jgi:hypothetical protein
MPAFADRLAREQICQIITYMRAPSSVAETSQK